MLLYRIKLLIKKYNSKVKALRDHITKRLVILENLQKH